jgi:DNA adenine methylase
MEDKVFVPPIKIQGIKTKLVPLIKKIVLVKKDTRWVEPFMGSGVVGFNICPKTALFCDTNPYIIDFYDQINNGKITSLLVRQYLEHEGQILKDKDAAYYYEVRERFNKEHNPLDFLFLNRSCFNGMIRFNRNYEFNVPYGHKPERFSKAYITKIVNQVKHLEAVMPLNNWDFKCQSFSKTISEACKNDFFYCDPPYIGRHVDYYDSWDEESETSLHNLLMASGTKFILSTWDHNKYRNNKYIDSLWKECSKITKNHFYHVGAKESNRNPMVEALLVNYPVKLELKLQVQIEHL